MAGSKIWVNWEIQSVDRTEQKRIQALFQKAVDQTMREEGIKVPVEISITVTSPESVRSLNRAYRQMDRTTDVLSFPLIEWNDEVDLDTWERNPDTDCVVLGDVVLNFDQAMAQAQEYGHSSDRELAFLLIHSLLHLLGYDHMEAADEKIMRAHQRSILEGLGLGRSDSVRREQEPHDTGEGR